MPPLAPDAIPGQPETNPTPRHSSHESARSVKTRKLQDPIFKSQAHCNVRRNAGLDGAGSAGFQAPSTRQSRDNRSQRGQRYFPKNNSCPTKIPAQQLSERTDKLLCSPQPVGRRHIALLHACGVKRRASSGDLQVQAVTGPQPASDPF